MEIITTITQLKDELSDTIPSDRPGIMKKIQIPGSEFTEYETWSESSYTRNCLFRDEQFELILICWSAKSKSPIHDHDQKDCWIYQVKGELIEKRYELENETPVLKQSFCIKTGELTYMHDRMGYHEIINDTNESSCSLHIYAAPIDTCEVYCPENKQFETKELSYDTELV